MDLEDIWRAAAQQVQGLLGKILWGRVEQVQVRGTQGVTGVVVAVRWQENLRAPVFV